MPVFVMVSFFLPFFYIPKFYFDGFAISYWLSYQQADLINFISVLNSIFLLSFVAGVGAVNDRSLISKKIVGILNNRLLFNIYCYKKRRFQYVNSVNMFLRKTNFIRRYNNNYFSSLIKLLNTLIDNKN